MNYKNERDLNQNKNFYCSCENEINNINQIKKTFKSMILSLIMFIIALLITIFAMVEFYTENSGAAGLIIVISSFLTLPSLIVSIVFSCNASNSIKKYIKSGFNVPHKVKIFWTINKLQIPLIIFVFIVGLLLKDKKYDNFINQKLNELYGTNYEIINTYSRSNESGTNYKLLVLQLENFEYPIISRFDWEANCYEDNYNELIQADNLDYHSYINSVFGNEVISLMYFDNYENYNFKQRKQINLNILLSGDYLNNQGDLKLKVKQIINNYTSQFPNYNLSFDIYFSNKIDNTLTKEYYIYISDADDYIQDFESQISSSIISGIHIRIDENTNIDAEIHSSFYNKY